MCGGYFPVKRQGTSTWARILLSETKKKQKTDPSLLSLPECFFLQITAPVTTAPVTMRRTRPTMMPMVRKEG